MTITTERDASTTTTTTLAPDARPSTTSPERPRRGRAAGWIAVGVGLTAAAGLAIAVLTTDDAPTRPAGVPVVQPRPLSRAERGEEASVAVGQVRPLSRAERGEEGSAVVGQVRPLSRAERGEKGSVVLGQVRPLSRAERGEEVGAP